MLLLYGVGVIIGAGIYSIIGAAAGAAGKAVWFSLLLAAAPALLVALCYAELVTMFPRAGGGYVYVREAWPRRRWASFLTGFLVAVTAAATAATVSVAFGGYLTLFVGFPGWIASAALLGLCTAVNIAGIRESSWVTAICTSVEVIGLVLIIGGAFKVGGVGRDVLDISPGPVLAGAALSFFVFTGFEGLANLAEETKKPERTLPLALLISLGVTTVLYVLVALAAVALVEPSELAASDSPLSTAAGAIGPRLATAIGWIALFSTANTALITLVVASRTLLAMAQEGHAPAPLARVLPKRKTPWIAALAIGGGAAALLPLGGVAVLGSVSSLTTLLVFVAVCGALIAIRVTRPDAKGGFRVPWQIGKAPLIPMLAIVASALLMTRFSTPAYATAGGALVAGIAAYSLQRRFGAKASQETST